MKYIIPTLLILLSVTPVYAVGPNKTQEVITANKPKYPYDGPTSYELSESKDLMQYICIDGYVFVHMGTPLRGGLAQLIVRDDTGLPVPAVCPKRSPR